MYSLQNTVSLEHSKMNWTKQGMPVQDLLLTDSWCLHSICFKLQTAAVSFGHYATPKCVKAHIQRTQVIFKCTFSPNIC